MSHVFLRACNHAHLVATGDLLQAVCAAKEYEVENLDIGFYFGPAEDRAGLFYVWMKGDATLGTQGQ